MSGDETSTTSGAAGADGPRAGGPSADGAPVEGDASVQEGARHGLNELIAERRAKARD